MITACSVLLVGLVSAKDRDYQVRLDALEACVTARGGAVLTRYAQRRGVSDGGVRLMTTPLSRRFLVGPGKLEEIAVSCATQDVDAVVFLNDLTDYQRRWLTSRPGCPVLTRADIERSALSLPDMVRAAARGIDAVSGAGRRAGRRGIRVRPRSR